MRASRQGPTEYRGTLTGTPFGGILMGEVIMWRFNILLEHDVATGSWVGFVPALNGLSTFGETREEALSNVREAIEGYVEAAMLEGIPISSSPVGEIVTLEFAAP